MYFWNIEKLTKDLKKWLSEEESFIYFFIWAIVISFINSFPTTEFGKYEIIFNLILSLIDVIMI
jgi:hypothetical protein